MAPGESNKFLDAPDSEDDQIDNYNSDNEITKGGRRAKRRKVESDDEDAGSGVNPSASDDEGSLHEDGQEGDSSKRDKKAKSTSRKELPRLETGIPDITKPLTKKNLVASEEAIRKSGVVYMSRIPPGMKPSALRALLSPYGKLNRIFLAPEDPTVRARRKRAGGNKRALFTEGWLEFVKKKEAKAACELLNGHNIGGKKGSFFRDDIWNLVYLKGFKWHNLTEQITTENAERTSRMRAEISKSTKENKEFVRNVERAKMLDGMQAKAKKRKASQVEDELVREGGRSFKQVRQVKKDDTGAQDQPASVTRVLSKIF
ncbi:Pre-rRNA-processing protein ESF2 [Metarhizium album ARSEF 1941]|uniref:18S rRNA factor 2 n=1 Tax=Metarhizium album (strain ARSEF 1941) TaxID=1081103 RepID=A0A0B2WPX6_METAS|nr:Pre-rRNA-processing protein ESF2 [Metarhizium album ARSEF 1941]KHN98096.1 Pre-rRNA-processing protein ESF2 [Metarhizium album ARSEF 1941]